MFKIILIFIFLLSLSTKIFSKNYGEETGLKIPRFVSLKSNNVNLRIGSSTNYPIILKYTKQNLPVQIIEEYLYWRKIIDIQENIGWIHKALLKGERYAIIKQTYAKNIIIYSKPEGIEIGEIGINNIVQIRNCIKNWCKIEFENNKGWINKKNLWGILDNEEINVSFFQPLINQFWKIDFKFKTYQRQ